MGAQCLAQTLPKCGDLAHLSQQGSGINGRRGSGRHPQHAQLQAKARLTRPSPAKFAMAWQFLLELMVLGAFTGFMAGLLGIGGGMLLVPFLTFMFTREQFGAELIVRMAIATSLTTILFSSVSSVRAHHKRGAVRWDIAGWMGLGAVLGTFAGAQVAGLLKSGWLAMFFAFFVGLSALRMLIVAGQKQAVGTAESLPLRPALIGTGSLIGFISSLLGAGGGFLTVPFLSWRGVGLRNAVATSAAMGFPIAAGGLAGYVVAGLHADGLPPGSLGYIYLPALFACAATSVLMAPVGATVAHRIHVQSLKRVFALLLLSLASYMLWKGVHAMGWIQA